MAPNVTRLKQLQLFLFLSCALFILVPIVYLQVHPYALRRVVKEYVEKYEQGKDSKLEKPGYKNESEIDGFPRILEQMKAEGAQLEGEIDGSTTTGGNMGGDAQDFSAGNATLGFQSILALSRGTPWRTAGLKAAATLTNLTITIPPQPGWSPEFTDAFQGFGHVDKQAGAAHAYLAHIDLLKYIIASDLSSALILEDDVDWDVRIKGQMRDFVTGINELSTKKNWYDVLSPGSETGEGSPYGDGWDVLWLGHCSDPILESCGLDEGIVSYDDETVVPWGKYRSLDTHITDVFENGTRFVHRSCSPVCTYAYAVSKAGARKVLDIAMTGTAGAFDLMLHFACKSGELVCISANPELFSPYYPAGGQTSEVEAGDLGKEGGVLEPESGEKGHTDNILESARCKALFESTCLE